MQCNASFTDGQSYSHTATETAMHPLPLPHTHSLLQTKKRICSHFRSRTGARAPAHTLPHTRWRTCPPVKGNGAHCRSIHTYTLIRHTLCNTDARAKLTASERYYAAPPHNPPPPTHTHKAPRYCTYIDTPMLQADPLIRSLLSDSKRMRQIILAES